jgi:hypothetical protein
LVLVLGHLAWGWGLGAWGMCMDMYMGSGGWGMCMCMGKGTDDLTWWIWKHG